MRPGLTTAVFIPPSLPPSPPLPLSPLPPSLSSPWKVQWHQRCLQRDGEWSMIFIALVALPPPADADGRSSGSVPGAHSRHDQGLSRQRREHPHTLTNSTSHTLTNSTSHTLTPSPTHSSHTLTHPHPHQPVPPTPPHYCTLHRPVSLATRQLFVCSTCCGEAPPT